MPLTNKIPTVPATFEMDAPRVRQVYPGLNAEQIRITLENLSIQPPARLPNSRSTWIYQYSNLQALLLGCISVSVSQFDRVEGKPRYQIVVERFATPLPQEAALTVEPS